MQTATKSIKVIATAKGYLGHKRRYPGDVFVLRDRKGLAQNDKGKLVPVTISAEQQFSENWMQRADPTAKVGPAPVVPKRGSSTAAMASAANAPKVTVIPTEIMNEMNDGDVAPPVLDDDGEVIDPDGEAAAGSDEVI